MVATARGEDSDLIIGVTPFEVPNAALAAALCRAGALGVLDVGRDPARARAALAQMVSTAKGPWGVRVPSGSPLEPDEVPTEAATILLPSSSRCSPAHFAGRRVLVEVSDPDEARRAIERGSRGLIARGSEGGGRVGDLTTYVLLQRLLADAAITVPVWACGGLGCHSASAAVAGGAAGVVLDAQLALLRESLLPKEIAAAIFAMDGSETAIVGGHRVYHRPDLPGRRKHWLELTDGRPLSENQVAARLGGESFDEQFVPIGQDGAFARGFAHEYVTAGRLVQGLRTSIATHLADSLAARPLEPDSPFARARGIRYPVVQGPMTRVSDRPAFAARVADAGGLPFLALALMDGAEVRTLLEDTASALGTRPWGVGILGFAPMHVREAQLEAIHSFRPPCALIAGGHPSQAAPLEAAGIATFMHVPSPGLLERFLREGARKFVFEGRECGGHVGPRGSFALWDAQVDTLLHHGGNLPAEDRRRFFSELHVLFAGGIHDERSAAMAAVLAAPLAADGAHIGVLMGTAYLFTQEAVQTEAILPTFQEAALACEDTALLETSPGHATRCARTPYVHTFEEAKRRLGGEGAAQQTMWAELEQLNLGRLRLATKGLRRSGDRLLSVDEDEQRAEGMVMIGQVAAQRSATTTIQTLHEQVTTGASRFLENTAARPVQRDDTPAHQSIDVAIIGMACIFPKAPDLEQYWANIVRGINAIEEVPSGRWNPDLHWDPQSTGEHAGRRTPSKWGGFIPPIPFDPLAYGIPPSSLIGIEPAQLLALHVARRALSDAGYAERNPLRERTSVIFGAEAGSDLAAAYNFRATYRSYFGELPPELDEEIPRLTEDSFPGGLSNVIAGRIANRLDLRGANYTVDAACASSLAALDIACKDLASGSSDMVLCGGVDLHNTVQDYFLFSSVHALSPHGQPRPFDAHADGIALGEGIACIVIKRLADAERDGDRIYAVIRSVAGSSDGRSLGLTAPRAEGQRLALRRAYEQAGVDPARVGLIEAHGTGTVVGDRTELASITDYFVDAGAVPGRCVIGSVKSQIGHTKCAAGIAGVIKAALALRTGVRPPTLALTHPNDAWDRATSPFVFTGTSLPWAAPAAERFAGVSGFGFGGTNFHAVLSAYERAPEPLHAIDAWPAELFVFRGDTRGDAQSAIADLETLIAANDEAGRPWTLRDLARTVAGIDAQSRHAHPAQVAIVASDIEDLQAKLRAVVTSEPCEDAFVRDEATSEGRVAFLFPGQGSQRPGMLADLFVAFPRMREWLVEGSQYAATMFPPAAFDAAGKSRQHEALTDTRVAQPALGIAGLAVHDLLASFGVRPDMAAGHSYGEIVALGAAGVIEARDLLQVSAARADAILGALVGDPGGMAAVLANAGATREALGPASEVVIANDNAPSQVVISGASTAIDAAVEMLAARGISAKRIPVACAFHSPLIGAAANRFARYLETIRLGEPRVEIWSNTIANRYPSRDNQMRALLADHLVQPVRFVEQIENMYAAGARIFVEAGPGRVLTQLVSKILGTRPHVVVPCDVPGEAGLHRLLIALAQLAVAGAPVDTAGLFEGRRAQTVSADAMPRRPGWIIDGHTVRTAEGNYLPGALRPARAHHRPFATLPAPVAGTAESDPREATVLEFLRTSRELIASQRDVVLEYLGGRESGFTAPRTGAAIPSEPEEAIETVDDSSIPRAPAQNDSHEPDVLGALIHVVSGRTGYPPEMLDPDLDLEADLSIDSIKRTEILGELIERFELSGPGAGIDQQTLAELSKQKTLKAIVTWITERTSPELNAPEAPAAESMKPAAERKGPPLRRWRVTPRSIEPPRSVVPLDRLRNHHFVLIADSNGISTALARLLRERGCSAKEVPVGEYPGPGAIDGLVYLATADRNRPLLLPHAFKTVQEALAGGASRLLVATSGRGQFSVDTKPIGQHHDRLLHADAGWPGLVRTVSRERPDVLARVVDLDPRADPDGNAARLLDELLDPDGPTVVGWTDGTRYERQLELHDLKDDKPSRPRIRGLDRDSVALLTGGARGITAHFALGLARQTGCHIALVGRSPLPADAEGPDTAAAGDEVSLRRLLTARGMRVPSDIDAAITRILTDREIRATISQLTPAAASVTYHVADVRDAGAVRNVIDRITRRHGRLDLIAHGAGVIEDRLVEDKEITSFERVWSTKVDGALALAAALPADTKYFVLFSSIAGVFGSRGQVDYAAANDALDTLARTLARQNGAMRTAAIDWGPWTASGGGMMSPSLELEYARRGIGVIAPQEGVDALFRELCWGDRYDAQVVYACADTESLQHQSPSDTEQMSAQGAR